MAEGKVVGLKALSAFFGGSALIVIVASIIYLVVFSGPNYCPEIDDMAEANIQLVGDSLFGSDADGCASVAGFMSLKLELRVTDHAIPGATVIGEDGIPSQYVSGDWEWTIVDGGGNDAMAYCSEGDDEECDEKLDEIITDDNKGLIPDLINKVKDDGSKVLILGYYDVPEGSEFEDLILEIEILNDRYKEYAEVNDDVYFISLKDIMSPEGTPDYYSDDLVHPSEEGHKVIGEHIADFITANN